MKLVKIAIAALVVFIAVAYAVRVYVTGPIADVERAKDVSVTDPAKLRAHVEALAAIEPPRIMPIPESLDKAAEYIRKEWQAMGYEVQDQTYEVEGNTYRNLIAEVGPKEGKIVVIGAHYDVCEEQPGADDNASGVAGLLELSRALKQNPPKQRTQLVAFTLEEPPAYQSEHMGSLIHARSLKTQNAEVSLMISLEMIGYFSDEPGSQTFPISLMRLDYPSTGNFIALVANLGNRAETLKAKALMRKHAGIPVFSINSPELVPGIDFSDHRSYWAQGYPALMVTDTAFYRNANYHKPSDRPETLDYKRMAEVVTGLVGLAREWTP